MASNNDTQFSDAIPIFVAFAGTLLSQMRTWAATEGIPRSTTIRTVFTEDGWKNLVEERPNYWGLLQRHYDSLWRLEEAEKCARYCLREGILSPPKMSDAEGQPIISPTFEQMKPFLILELVRPILVVVEQDHTLTPSDAELSDAFRKYVEAWTAESIPWDVTVPLLNFTSTVPHARIGTVELATFTPEEKTVLWFDGSFSDQLMDSWSYSATKFKLLGSYTQPKDEPHSLDGLIGEIGRVITALRLLKPGDVGASAVISVPRTEAVRVGGTVQSLLDSRARSHSEDYVLDESDLPALITLYETLQSAERGGFLRALTVALRRFNQTYSRDNAEDRVIDATIALESSLLADVQDELKYRLALRGAALLADQRDPQETRLLLEATYDARSAIVHQGKLLGEIGQLNRLKQLDTSKTPYDLPVEVENLLRDVLRSYLAKLSAGRSIKNINVELDRRVVRGLANTSQDT